MGTLGVWNTSYAAEICSAGTAVGRDRGMESIFDWSSIAVVTHYFLGLNNITTRACFMFQVINCQQSFECKLYIKAMSDLQLCHCYIFA